MDLIMKKNSLNDLLQLYKKVPSKDLEFGGIFCGSMGKESVSVEKIITIPSSIPSRFEYNFNINSMKLGRICGNNQIVGLWHTHDSNYPTPSVIDRQTSKDLNLPSCVMTNSLNCFLGDKNMLLRVKEL